jgi:hypothetical protein
LRQTIGLPQRKQAFSGKSFFFTPRTLLLGRSLGQQNSQHRLWNIHHLDPGISDCKLQNFSRLSSQDD